MLLWKVVTDRVQVYYWRRQVVIKTIAIDGVQLEPTPVLYSSADRGQGPERCSAYGSRVRLSGKALECRGIGGFEALPASYRCLLAFAIT